MDKSKFKSSEKKDLPIEDRSINDRLNTTVGGLYLSVAAITIILLILIILL